MRVYKYELRPDDYVEISMPKGARVLAVGAQKEIPQMWALVDPTQPSETRRFRFAGTGHMITEQPEELTYIGTFQMYGGSLIFHIFEVKDNRP